MRIGFLLALMVACSKGEESPTTPDGSTDSGMTDTGAEAEEAPPPLMNGLYSSGFLVGPVAGLVVGLQLEFEMSMDDDQNRTIDRVVLRAANDAGEVSEDLAEATSIPVDSDGNMTVDWPLFTLPAAFSPTSGDVDIESVMVGQIRSEDFACGEVQGEIVSFSMDLAGSTFGTTPWDERIL